ncbi:MAG: type II toxin-antitoxin system VapC family toxin [Gemmatimonadetes bacterium]|nr:type II toxin-antitoxin system VapC family toxin [Gemmatimonadota bacterium]
MDTHVWVWWHTAPEKLSPAVRDMIINLDATDQLLMSVISVWEVAKLVEKNRLRLRIEIDQWVEQALNMSHFQLLPLSPEIAIESTRLPQPFHQDPSDQMIVASARLFDATVLTVDQQILSYPHVRALW